MSFDQKMKNICVECRLLVSLTIIAKIIVKVKSLLQAVVSIHLSLTVSALCTHNTFVIDTDNNNRRTTIDIYARSNTSDATDGVVLKTKTRSPAVAAMADQRQINLLDFYFQDIEMTPPRLFNIKFFG
jgi:hypothetical protein